jgi:hypothetical protein
MGNVYRDWKITGEDGEKREKKAEERKGWRQEKGIGKEKR